MPQKYPNPYPNPLPRQQMRTISPPPPRSERLPTLAVGPYDPVSDTILIEGTQYSGVLFREGYGFNAMAGQIHRIDRRDDGVVTITRLYELEDLSK